MRASVIPRRPAGTLPQVVRFREGAYSAAGGWLDLNLMELWHAVAGRTYESSTWLGRRFFVSRLLREEMSTRQAGRTEDGRGPDKTTVRRSEASKSQGF